MLERLRGTFWATLALAVAAAAPGIYVFVSARFNSSSYERNHVVESLLFFVIAPLLCGAVVACPLWWLIVEKWLRPGWLTGALAGLLVIPVAYVLILIVELNLDHGSPEAKGMWFPVALFGMLFALPGSIIVGAIMGHRQGRKSGC